MNARLKAETRENTPDVRQGRGYLHEKHVKEYQALLPVVIVLIALVVLGLHGARSQIFADILVLKSGEQVEGRFINESEMSVTKKSKSTNERFFIFVAIVVLTISCDFSNIPPHVAN